MGELVTVDLNPNHETWEPKKEEPKVEPKKVDPPKAAAPPKPKKPEPTAPKLSTIPKRVDVGEQMIGSRHTYGVATIVNVGKQVGTSSGHSLVEGAIECEEEVEGDDGKQNAVKCAPGETPFFSDWTVPRAIDRPVRLEVGFAPTRIGNYRGLLRFVTNWGNGSIEEHQVELVGRAIDQTTMPARRPGQVAPIRSPTTIAPADRRLSNQVPQNVRDDFEHRANGAKDAAAGLADAQGDGVKNVESLLNDYERKPESAPWWIELAETAISIGIAGVAGAVAKHLTTAIASDLGRSWSKDSMQHLGVTDAIKDGIKTGGKRAIAEAKGSSGKASYAKSEFFAKQRAVLTKLTGQNRAMIEQTRYDLLPYLAKDEQSTLATMDAVKTGLLAAQSDATELQQTATEQRWISGVAQQTGYHVTSKAPDGETVHRTGTGAARRGGDRDGILTLKVVAHDEDVSLDSAVEVQGATLDGIPQPMADKLKDEVLADVPIPIMLDVTGAIEARITRDEAGIVEFTGTGGKWLNNAAQNHKLATQLVRRVLARKLLGPGGWRVKHIKTDDKASK